MRRRWVCVPMITLCLLLAGCGDGETEQDAAEAARAPYQAMTACTMTAEVTGEDETRFTLRCSYVPEGETTVEVLAPETVAGVKAVIQGEELSVAYEDLCLPAGLYGGVSPAACLPRLMSALRSGWLLEQNREDWGETPCLRLAVDQTEGDGKIVSTLWLREDDHTPVRGEISVDGKKYLSAEFTDFAFDDIIAGNGAGADANK